MLGLVLPSTRALKVTVVTQHQENYQTLKSWKCWNIFTRSECSSCDPTVRAVWLTMLSWDKTDDQLEPSGLEVSSYSSHSSPPGWNWTPSDTTWHGGRTVVAPHYIYCHHTVTNWRDKVGNLLLFFCIQNPNRIIPQYTTPHHSTTYTYTTIILHCNANTINQYIRIIYS